MAPRTKQPKIPPIKDLREELDYGDPHSDRFKDFRKSVRDFQQTFVSSQGLDSISIRDLKSKDHQSALDEMVQSFLEEHQNGKRFWPDDKSGEYGNKLQYSTEGARIESIMKDYFWRVNLYRYQNSINRKKDTGGSSRANRERAPSEDLGIDEGVGDEASASRNAAGTPGTPRSSTFIDSDAPFHKQSDIPSPAPHSAHPHMSNQRPVNEDLHRVLDGPEPQTLRPTDQPTFEVMSTGIDQNGRQVAPVANMDPFTDHPQGNDQSSTRMSAKKAGKQPAGVGKTRASTRKRTLRNVFGRATDNAVEAALHSPERNPSPEVIECPAPAETNNEVTSDIVSSPLWNSERANRSRATFSEVTDDRVSVSGFLQQLGPDTGLDSVDTSNSVNHEGPSEQARMIEAAPRPSVEVKSDSRQASLISLSSSSAPMETQQAADERPPENNTRSPAPPPPVGQSRVEFTYCVVCRCPELQSIYWKPEGSFRNKTLSELEEELPIHVDWSQFQYLHFQLTAPKTRAEHLVRRGSEGHFDSMKRRLAFIISNCIAKMPRDKTILIDIDIEPLSDENARKKSADNEVMDFEW